MRYEAIAALAGDRLDNEAALTAITHLLDDTDPNVRREALFALSSRHLRPKLVVPKLLGLLDDMNNRQRAAEALGGYGDQATIAVPALARLARTESDDDQFRPTYWTAFEALHRIGPAAKKMLEELARDDDPQLSFIAGEYLSQMKRDQKRSQRID